MIARFPVREQAPPQLPLARTSDMLGTAMKDSRLRRPSRFGALDYVKLTVLGLGLSGLWTSLNSIVLPIRLLVLKD